MARITRFLVCLLLAVVGLLNASPKQHVFGFGKRGGEALGDPEVDWNAMSKRLSNGKFMMGFGKRGLNKQFTMGFGKRVPADEELLSEDYIDQSGRTSLLTKGLGKRLYGLNDLPGLRTIQYMGLGKRSVLSREVAANLRRFNLGLGRR